MKSVVRVDGGGTGIAIDVGRDRGDDGWDDSHAHADGGGVVVREEVAAK